MAYKKTIWKNEETPLSATNLNHMEDGIENASNIVDSLAVRMESAEERLTTTETDIDAAEERLTMAESDIHAAVERLTKAESDINAAEVRLDVAVESANTAAKDATDKAEAAAGAAQAATDAAERALKAAENAQAEDRAAAITELNKQKLAYLWIGSEEEFEDQKDTLPNNTICFPDSDPLGEAMEEHLLDKENPHGVTPEQIGAAPAGYGWGEITKVIDSSFDLNNLPTEYNARYYWGSSAPLNAPIFNGNDGMYGNLTVLTGSNYMMQIANSEYSLWGQYIQVRTRTVRNSSKEWTPWEWVNPPMVVGVEYRTTERYNGKSVYRQLINCGIASDGGDVNLYGAGLTSSCKVIRNEGSLLDAGLSVPYGRGDTKKVQVSLAINSGVWHVYPAVGADYTGKFELTLQLWYTKE